MALCAHRRHLRTCSENIPPKCSSLTLILVWFLHELLGETMLLPQCISVVLTSVFAQVRARN